MRSNFRPKSGSLSKPVILVFDAIDSEEIDQVVKHGNAADIEPYPAMTERLGHEKKKSAAATDIEDLPRREPVQVEILGALDVTPQVLFDVDILRVMAP